MVLLCILRRFQKIGNLWSISLEKSSLREKKRSRSGRFSQCHTAIARDVGWMRNFWLFSYVSFKEFRLQTLYFKEQGSLGLLNSKICVKIKEKIHHLGCKTEDQIFAPLDRSGFSHSTSIHFYEGHWPGSRSWRRRWHFENEVRRLPFQNHRTSWFRSCCFPRRLNSS